ncbi:hypothetical protein ASF43_08545 [Pseudorhodoferax sp. Leaf267]|nr:hypothetical protein ASF43_08545 [Pseudorhodoferax sp. Leaf267]
MLACAGLSHASQDSTPLASISNSVAARFQQVGQLMEGGASQGRKAEVAYKPSGDRTASKAQLASDKDSNNAMLVAGLLIMGVIIKRRYGKGD